MDIMERNRFIETNQKMIWSRVHVWKHVKRVPPADLFQEGVLGMIRGLETWTPDGGATLTGHVWRYVDGYVRNAEKPGKCKSKYAHVSTALHIESDNGGESTSIENLVEAPNTSVSDQAKTDLAEILPIMEEVLSPVELAVIKMRFGIAGVEACDNEMIVKVLTLGYSYECTAQNISHIMRRGMEKIRTEVRNRNL